MCKRKNFVSLLADGLASRESRASSGFCCSTSATRGSLGRLQAVCTRLRLRCSARSPARHACVPVYVHRGNMNRRNDLCYARFVNMDQEIRLLADRRFRRSCHVFSQLGFPSSLEVPV